VDGVEGSRWSLLGNFTTRKTHKVQRFDVPLKNRDWGKYVLVRPITFHYEREYYCTLSYLQVYGVNTAEHIRLEMESLTEDIVKGSIGDRDDRDDQPDVGNGGIKSMQSNQIGREVHDEACVKQAEESDVRIGGSPSSSSIPLDQISLPDGSIIQSSEVARKSIGNAVSPSGDGKNATLDMININHSAEDMEKGSNTSLSALVPPDADDRSGNPNVEETGSSQEDNVDSGVRGMGIDLKDGDDFKVAEERVVGKDAITPIKSLVLKLHELETTQSKFGEYISALAEKHEARLDSISEALEEFERFVTSLDGRVDAVLATAIKYSKQLDRMDSSVMIAVDASRKSLFGRVAIWYLLFIVHIVSAGLALTAYILLRKSPELRESLAEKVGEAIEQGINDINEVVAAITPGHIRRRMSLDGDGGTPSVLREEDSSEKSPYSFSGLPGSPHRGLQSRISNAGPSSPTASGLGNEHE